MKYMKYMKYINYIKYIKYMKYFNSEKKNRSSSLKILPEGSKFMQRLRSAVDHFLKTVLPLYQVFII